MYTDRWLKTIIEMNKILIDASFQIRKMVGALCAFAMGRITERDVYELLTIPSISAWNLLSAEKNIEVAPAYGLYFAGINYKSEEEWSLDPHDVRSKSFFQ